MYEGIGEAKITATINNITSMQQEILSSITTLNQLFDSLKEKTTDLYNNWNTENGTSETIIYEKLIARLLKEEIPTSFISSLVEGKITYSTTHVSQLERTEEIE